MNPYMELPLLNQRFHGNIHSDHGHSPVSGSTDTLISAVAFRSVGAIESLMRRLVDGHRQRRRLRRAVTELSALDDRTLRDIGIDRSEIPSVVRETQRAEAAVRDDRPRHRVDRIVSRPRIGTGPANDNRRAPGRREIA